jgi:dTDP-4-dehydrorhamnose reductase
MNILVTGGQGQLGNSLKTIAKNQNKHNYIFSDIIGEDNIIDICNINNIKNFINNNNIDYIVNCAAYTNVNKAETEKDLCFNINEIGIKNLSIVAKEYNIKVIHISTDYVFDGNSFLPYNENNNTNPTSIYGLSKLNGELAAFSNNKNTIVIRTSWLYSEFCNNFVKTMIKLGNEKPNISVVFDQIGTPTYAYDLAIAIDTIINNDFIPGIYHFSNEGVCSWYDFTKEIFELSNINCYVIPIHTSEYPTPVKRPYYSVLDKTKIKDTYNVDVPYWKISLKKCINNIINNY